MKTIALNRLNLLGIAKGNGLKPVQKKTFQAELAHLGYRLTNPEMLDEVSEAFLLDYKHLMSALAAKRGANVNYVPLFTKFPEETPNDDEYFIKRIMGYVGQIWEQIPDSVELTNGVRVPKWLFNVEDFGADPITQFQSADLWKNAVEADKNKKGDTHIEWIDLTIATDDEIMEALREYLKRLVYSKSSIKEDLHVEVYALLDFFGAEELDPASIVFKETQALVLQSLWSLKAYEDVKAMAKTATDVLRMFAGLTGTDISLAEKVKFPKMNRSERRVVLDILEASSGLSEDIRNYKGLWLEIGRYLHPGEYAKAYPRTAEVFDALRNGKIETFASKTEKLMALKELDDLLVHLEAKPGVFARKLHEVLRRFPNETSQVLDSFEKNVAHLPVKNLLVLRSYFNTINSQEFRTVINKKGKIKVLLNNAHRALSRKQVGEIVGLLDHAILKALSDRESWEDKSVWIDKTLDRFTVPLAQRKASDGIITVGRGTRMNVDFDKVLRLFVYWKETAKRTDLDLSVIQFDKNFKYRGHVSYTNLKSSGIVHSGDIQSAPMGASEFIDITLDKLPRKVKYLAVQVYKYCGDNFVDIDCHAGWMIRKDVSSDVKAFDAKTVANKFDLNGVAAYAIPIIVDLDAAEIIFTDLYVGGRAFHNNVEGAHSDISLICEQVAGFVESKPLVSELAYAHAMARRAKMVADREEADITFGVSDSTYNATDVEQILSELI